MISFTYRVYGEHFYNSYLVNEQEMSSQRYQQEYVKNIAALTHFRKVKELEKLQKCLSFIKCQTVMKKHLTFESTVQGILYYRIITCHLEIHIHRQELENSAS